MEKLVIAGREFNSRLFLGTGKFNNNALMAEAIKASETEMVTVAMKRIELEDKQDDLLSHIVQNPNIQLLPNTSGVRNAEEAVFAAQMAREAFGTNWLKLEIHPDPRYLLPDSIETLKATEKLVKLGFVVLPYCQADPTLCKHLEEAGAATVMPLAAPIGTNKGLRMKDFLQIIIEQATVPVVVDAGIGAPSHAAEAMEMGASACLVNTAIAVAGDPVEMAKAFKEAVVCGRRAYEAGLVAIAFVFGLVVMWLTRIIFTFNYKKHLRWTIALFGGVGVTSIFYFLIVSGLKGSNLLKDLGVSDWIDHNHGLLLLCCFGIFTVLAEILHLLKVNIFKIIVLFGTFSLAMAFAGNDLVNFIGTPLAGLESFLDFTHNGNGEAAKSYTMGVLAGESALPYKHLFLLAAGIIMTTAVCTSKKAHKVVQTTVNLSRQDEGEEVFSSSRIARKTVRSVLNTTNAVSRYIPNNVKSWINTRFNSEEATLDDGVAFDLVRASVNLVLAGLLIVVGTTLQLPLSTTYVAFMVAMGSSLADRAWGRESAVFRITGVISVIGGWLVTAGKLFRNKSATSSRRGKNCCFKSLGSGAKLLSTCS